MFGLFQSDVKKARRLRLEFEDIRQRYLLKFNDYQRFSLSSAVEILLTEIEERIENLRNDDRLGWKALGDELLLLSQKAYTHWSKAGSGIGPEGGMAGSEGLALLSVRAHAMALNVAEAVVLVSDMDKFLLEIGTNK